MAKKQINVTINQSQAKFLQMPNKFRGFIAGFGCVHPDTKIWTEHGLMRISDITYPVRVLSFDEINHKFVFSLSGGSFPKGRANLYRVLTSQGEFLSSGHHRVFSSDYKYVRVDSLCEGMDLFSFDKNLFQTNLVTDLLLSSLNDQSWSEKDVSLMDHYAILARQYGQRFLMEEDTVLTSFQEQDDVQELFLHDDFFSNEHMDDLMELTPIHIHQDKFFCRKKNYRSLFHELSQLFYEGDQTLALPPGHTFDSHSKEEIFPLKIKSRRKDQQLVFDENSFLNPSKVIKVSVEECSVYYDMQVVNTNNYVCENGLIHHNSGKTWTGSLSTCLHHYKYPKVNSGYFAPTYPHIRDIFFPTIEEVAEKMGMEVEIKESNKEVHFYSGKKFRGVCICRSMDKPQNIIGFKIGHALIDELDVLPMDKAELAWRKIIARMRYKQDGLRNGIDVTTTPEGFKFAHKLFVETPALNPKLKDNYGYIQASTYDNAINLPDDYISSLLESYPEQLIQAYLNGEFVNLTAGTVYRDYDRIRNISREIIKPEEPLYIGMDFNVTNMSAAIGVKRECNIHIVDELCGVYDTPEMIRILKERYLDNGHTVYVYPDASGGSRKTVDASISDIALLERAGFIIRARSANPPVKDRIISLNNAFSKSRLYVNELKAKTLASHLEKLAYDKNGEPDKQSGFDHLPDALGYLVYYEMPVYKPILKAPITFVM